MSAGRAWNSSPQVAKRNRLLLGGQPLLPPRAPGPSPRALPLTPAPRPPTQRRVHVTALLGNGAGGAPGSSGRPRRGRLQGWEGNCLRGGGWEGVYPTAAAQRPASQRRGSTTEGGPSCWAPRPAHWRRPGAASAPAGGRLRPPGAGPSFLPTGLDSLGHTTVRRGRAERRIHFGFWEKIAARLSATGKAGYRGRRSLAGSWRGREANEGGRGLGSSAPFHALFPAPGSW